MLVKKLLDSWKPIEKPDLQVGETFEVTDPTALILSGTAVIVDENGVEQPLPGQKFSCPICYKETSTLEAFTSHVTENHERKASVPTATTIATEGKFETASEAMTKEAEVVVTNKVDDIRARRLAALEKARAARRAKLGK